MMLQHYSSLYLLPVSLTQSK